VALDGPSDAVDGSADQVQSADHGVSRQDDQFCHHLDEPACRQGVDSSCDFGDLLIGQRRYTLLR